VHLARDPFGIKPLYYATWAGGLAFASEIKALLELPQVSRRADPQGVYDYLYQGLVDHDEHTMFADVRQLPPGSYVSVAVATARPGPVQRYWQPQPLERTSLSFRGAVDELRELFLDSIRLHLRSDVPVGAALSGGVDSSSIVAAMRQVAGADLDLRTFSFVADEEAIDESRWANLVAEAAGAQRHLVHVETDEFIRDLDHLIRVQDQPFASTSIYAQHRVMQAARASGVTVMLDGQGADELFAGYRVYARNRVHGQLRRGKVSAAVRLARSTAALPGGESANKALVGAAVPGQVRATRQLLRNARAGLKERDAWFVDNHVAWSVSMRPRDLRKLLVDHVTTSSLPALLRYEDRNSMAFSIESRVPFLTVPLAEFAMSMPDEYLVDDEGRGKAVLREAMRGITPDPILDRRDKIGFATPEASWLTAIRPWITTAMASDARRRIPLAWAAGEDAVPFGDPRLWRWVNLVRWTEIFEVEYA
jgi:asparagine synthase (glutamine-hydrolysing)